MSNKIISVLSILVTGIGIGSVLAFLFLGQFTWKGKSIQENRNNLIRLYELLEPGQSDTAAAKTIITHIRKERIHADQNNNSNVWYVSAPPEFFVTHWVLVVYIQDQVITCVRFGTGDDVNVTPADAPKQKGICK